MKKHYKHERFVSEIVAASVAGTIADASHEWEFSHFGIVRTRYGNNCQICHSRIKKFIAIKNKANGLFLFIGHDCYDKLLYFLEHNAVKSVRLGARREYTACLKKYCKKNISEAFIEWCEAQENFPYYLRDALRVFRQIGFAPSMRHAKDLVEYYKSHRLFAITDLLNMDERRLYDSFRHKKKIPSHVTLADFARVQKILTQWEHALLERQQKELEEIRTNVKRREEEERLQREEKERKEWESSLQAVRPYVAYGRSAAVYKVEKNSGYNDTAFGDAAEEVRVFVRLGGAHLFVKEKNPKKKGGLFWNAFEREKPDSVRLAIDHEKREIHVAEEDWGAWLQRAEKRMNLEKMKQERNIKQIKKKMHADAQKCLKEKKEVLTLSFQRGINPRSGEEQWQAKKAGMLYVLDKEEAYTEGKKIAVVVVFTLVLGRIFLVKRVRKQCFATSNKVQYEVFCGYGRRKKSLLYAVCDIPKE